MKIRSTALITALILTVFANLSVQGQTLILGDGYTAANSGSGFNLGKGINSGINPPTTRLTGIAAANMRYIATDPTKAASSYTISTNALKVASATSSGRFTFSTDGTTPFDFSSRLGTAAATPEFPSVYEVTVSVANNAAGTQRCSFGVGTVENNVTFWDFGIQLYHANASDDFYTIRKRIDTGSTGLSTDLNIAIATTASGTYGNQIDFLIHITDAGAEAAPSTNTRIQVSMDGGSTWFYDTATDSDLAGGFRFDAASRFIMWDIAGSAAPTYDNFSLTFISGPTVATRTWTGGGADDNWSSDANWGGLAPVNGDSITFNGVTRQTNINDIVDLTVATVKFGNGGFSLSGNELGISGGVTNSAGINTFLGNVALSSTAIKTWGIANASEVVLNNTTTVEVNGDNNINGGGALRVKGTMSIGQSTTANPAFIINEGQHVIDGGTYISRGGYRIGSQATGIGAQTILTNNANFSLTVSGAALRVGDSANPVTARLVIDNSTLSMAAGNMGIPYAAGATSEVSQVGGLFTGGIINFNQTGAGNGTYTIRNGTLEPLQIKRTTAGGQTRINFDNAVLRSVSGANPAFFSGVDVAEIQAGGLVLDAQTDVNIAQVLSGSGMLVKSNFAAVTLTGANTYSGNTVIQQGKLSLPTVQTNATAVQVADGAELGVNVVAPGTTLSIPSVNFSGNSFGTLSFDLGSFSNPTAPLAKIPNLSVSGPVSVNVANGLQLNIGTIVLVDYDGTIGGGFQFTKGTLPPGVVANLVNNTANSSIDLVITGVPGFRWTGAVNGDWDGGTQNWIDLQTGQASAFSDGYPAIFPDGATTGIINIPGFPTPSIISVSNTSLPYVWSGGAITTAKVKKFGTNSLTRVDGAADLISEIELNAGSYIANDSSDTTFAAALTDASNGDGTFVKAGLSTLTLTSSNTTFDGAIVVQQGLLKLNSTNSPLGTTNKGITIASGATLDVNDLTAPGEPVIVSGTGYVPFGASTGLGAIIDSTTGGAVANNLTDVTMAGDTTFGAPNGGRWDIRIRSSTGVGPGLRGNGFNLTKIGSGSLSIACQRNLGAATPYWEMNLGDVFLNEGGLTFAESLSLGNPSKNINVAPGASLGFYGLGSTNPIVRKIFMTDATITGGGGTGDTNILNGAIQLTGVNQLRPLDANLIVNGALGGSGSLNVSVTGVGALFLNGANTFPGDTVVTNGTLGGSGSLAGKLIMLGGTLAPGQSPGEIGTFTVNGGITLAGITAMNLNRSLSPNSDRLVAGGSLTFGGILTVTLGTGASSPQAGDVYQLFNKAASGTFDTVNLPNLSGLPGGLAWDTSALNAGTLKVTGTATPPTINSVSASGGNLVFSGTGGVEGGNYIVRASTNVALPVTNWVAISTNVFGPGGSFNYTNAINPTTPQTFFLLQVP